MSVHEASLRVTLGVHEEDVGLPKVITQDEILNFKLVVQGSGAENVLRKHVAAGVVTLKASKI